MIDLIFSTSSLLGLSPRMELDVVRIEDIPFQIMKAEIRSPAHPSTGIEVNLEAKAAPMVTMDVSTSDRASAPLADKASEPVSFPTLVFILQSQIFTSTVKNSTPIIKFDTDIS